MTKPFDYYRDMQEGRPCPYCGETLKNFGWSWACPNKKCDFWTHHKEDYDQASAQHAAGHMEEEFSFLERFGELTAEDENSSMEKPERPSAEVAVEIEWPVPWSTGAPMPLVLAADRVFLIYYATEIVPNHSESTVKVLDEIESRHPVALVEFLCCYDLRFGGPNDEVYTGQPLYGKGLELYAAHVVKNSNWLSQVEEINKVHAGYDPDGWRRLKHHLLLFHDEQFECLARSYYIEVYNRKFDEVVEIATNKITGRDKWLKNTGSFSGEN